MTYDFLTHSYALIGDDDAKLLGRASGLIRDGLVIVRPAGELTLSQRNEGAARVSLMLTELKQQHELLSVEQQVVSEQAGDVARRLERDTHKPQASAQEILDEQHRQLQERTRKQSKAPATVSRDNPKAIGEHAESIARGDTKVV